MAAEQLHADKTPQDGISRPETGTGAMTSPVLVPSAAAMKQTSQTVTSCHTSAARGAAPPVLIWFYTSKIGKQFAIRLLICSMPWLMAAHCSALLVISTKHKIKRAVLLVPSA
jgi:hypothetical protein